MVAWHGISTATPAVQQTAPSPFLFDLIIRKQSGEREGGIHLLYAPIYHQKPALVLLQHYEYFFSSIGTRSRAFGLCSFAFTTYLKLVTTPLTGRDTKRLCLVLCVRLCALYYRLLYKHLPLFPPFSPFLALLSVFPRSTEARRQRMQRER